MMADRKRFSPSAGWDDVREMAGRHSQVLIALAGAFFLLPVLVLSFLGPASDFATLGPDPEPAAIWEAFRPLLPWMFVFLLIQMAGQLAILGAIAPRGSTVGEAIATGFARMPYLLFANLVLLVLVMAIMLPFLLLIGVLAMAGPAGGAIGLLVGVAMVLFYVYIYLRFSLLAAILAVEDVRWPMPLLLRSWNLTRGNVFAIFVFIFIVLIVFLVVTLVVSTVFGTILSLAGLAMQPGDAGAAILAVINGLVSAAGATVFLLMQLAIYNQLAGTAEAQ